MSGKSSPKAVLTRLMHLAEGIAKHAHDPGFPDLSWIGDAAAERELLADSLVKAHALRDQAKAATGASQAQLTRAVVLSQKLTRAVQAWAGTRSDMLRDFGLTPHKVRAKRAPKAGAAGHTGKPRGATHAAEGGAGGDSSTGSPAPAPTPATTGGK